MICPACKTNNINHQDTQNCSQCGSDLYVHRLLRKISEAAVINEIANSKQESPKKSNWLFIVWQVIIPTVFLVVFATFGIFVEMRILAFIDYREAHRIAAADKRSEITIEQLQQMSTTIKQELDLILDQRRENQTLQTRIQELTAAASQNIDKNPVTSSTTFSSHSTQGEKQ